MHKKILLIEDEEELRENLQEILELNGFEIYSTTNGEEGLKLSSEIQFDAILSDLMMPVMDGITFLKHIKKNENYVHVPVIILTAKIDRIAYRTGMESGADDFLTKPVKSGELLSAINSAIENSLHKKMVLNKQFENALHIERNVRYHELRTPLFGVISSLELLLDPDIELSSQEKRELLESSSKSAKRLNKSLQKIHLFQFLHIQKAGLNKIIECYTFIQEKLKSNKDSNKIYQITKTEDDLKINFPLDKFDFIITELINNAYTFGKGKLAITINSKERVIKFSNIQNDIKEAKTLSPEPFKHFSDEYNEKNGLGLGLYIIKEYLNQQNSSLLVQVSPNLEFSVNMYFNS
jgi:two-component system, sensor histidine kinase and response regulator